MLRSIVAHIWQPATKAKDSLPQEKKAHAITVQLSRRSGRVTPGTLSSSVVKGVGAGSTEKRRDADDTLERVQCTVHATDGERQQQRHKAVDGLPRQLPIIRPSPTLPSTTLSSPAIPSSNVSSSAIPSPTLPPPSPPIYTLPTRCSRCSVCASEPWPTMVALSVSHALWLPMGSARQRAALSLPESSIQWTLKDKSKVRGDFWYDFR